MHPDKKMVSGKSITGYLGASRVRPGHRFPPTELPWVSRRPTTGWTDFVRRYLDTPRSPAHQAGIASYGLQWVSDISDYCHTLADTHTPNVQTNITAWTHQAHPPTKLELSMMFMASRFQILLLSHEHLQTCTQKWANKDNWLLDTPCSPAHDSGG